MTPVKPHFTPAKRAGDLVFVSGQLPFDESGKIVDGGIEAQTRRCLQQVEQALADVGVGLDELVKVMVWLTATEDFPAFNVTYAQYFPESPPARATVCSALMVPGARIEIEAVAYCPIES